MPRLTVATPATDRALITLAIVKDELNVTGSASDAKLTRWIAEETARITAHCGAAADQLGRRTFASEDMVVTFNAAELADGWDYLALPWRIPVTAVASVTVDGTALETTEYEAEPMSALLYRLDADGNRTTWEAYTTIVTLTAGWALTGDDHPLMRRACLDLVRARYMAGNRDPNLKVDEAVGVSRFEYWVNPTSPDADGLPSEIAAMVASYTSPVVG